MQPEQVNVDAFSVLLNWIRHLNIRRIFVNVRYRDQTKNVEMMVYGMSSQFPMSLI